jgi:hypothetical protein
VAQALFPGQAHRPLPRPYAQAVRWESVAKSSRPISCDAAGVPGMALAPTLPPPAAPRGGAPPTPARIATPHSGTGSFRVVASSPRGALPAGRPAVAGNWEALEAAEDERRGAPGSARVEDSAECCLMVQRYAIGSITADATTGDDVDTGLSSPRETGAAPDSNPGSQRLILAGKLRPVAMASSA